MSWFRPRPTPVTLGQQLALQRYRRISGLFCTFVPPPTLDPTLVNRFTKLSAAIAAKIPPPDAPMTSVPGLTSDVHALNLVFLRLAPLPVVTAFMHTIREDFREAVGDDGYQRYLTSPTSTALAATQTTGTATERDAALRAEAIYLVNETTRQTENQAHIEEVRRAHIMALAHGWKVFVPTLFLIGILVLSATLMGERYAEHLRKKPHEKGKVGEMVSSYLVRDGEALPLQHVLYATGVLALAGAAGACGSYVSYLMRLLGVAGQGQITRNLSQFQNSITVARLTPTLGVAYGLLISWIFAARFINGSLFPEFDKSFEWYRVVYLHTEFAKWLVWAFIAGFSERLVPDMLDKIISRSQTALNNIGGGAPPGAGAGNGNGNGNGNGQAQGAAGGGRAAGNQPVGDPSTLLVVREDADTLRATWAAIAGAVKYRLSSGIPPAPLSPIETRRTELALTPVPATGTLTVQLEGLDATGAVVGTHKVSFPLA